MSEVQVDHQGGVAVLTIDRPHARNAIGVGTIDGLRRAFVEVAASDAAVLVIRGAGDRAFVSGGDLKELEAVRTEEDARAMASGMRDVLDALARMPMPVIAALNGHALGGGAEVAVAADMRVAAADVKIGFTQSVLGIMPAWGGVERLIELVGRSRALLLITSGRVLEAAEAHELGLVEEVFSRESFESAWRALAERIAALPAGATRAIKAVVNEARPNVHDATRTAAIAAFARLWASDAHWEAAAAAEARRKAGRSST